jgi:hypothetical protein
VASRRSDDDVYGVCLVPARFVRPFVKAKQQRLAIIRYNYVSVEHVRGLSKRQIIGYLVKVSPVFPLLHPDAFEQESLSCHLHTHGRHIPVARDNFCLLNFKVASLVQVSQDAVAICDRGGGLIFRGRTIEFQLHSDQGQYQQEHDGIGHNER